MLEFDCAAGHCCMLEMGASPKLITRTSQFKIHNSQFIANANITEMTDINTKT